MLCRVVLFLFIIGRCVAGVPFGHITAPIKVTHYSLYLKPDFYHDREPLFTGHVTIHFIATRTSRFQYHAGTTVSNLTLYQGSQPHKAAILSQEKNSTTDIVTLTFDRKLNGRYGLKFYFSGKIQTWKPLGLYLSDENGARIMTSQFQAIEARSAFPCIDQPNMKATFQLTVARPPDHIALSNTPIQESINKGDWVEDVFETTPKMSTYLLALTIFKGYNVARETLKSGVEVSVWCHGEPESLAMFNKLGPMIEFMEGYTGIKYPIRKYDNIGFSHFAASAMENFGLVTWDNASLRGDSHAVLISAHEIAHQWIGNIITTRDWEFTWFQEGGATFFAWLLCEEFLEYGEGDLFEHAGLTTALIMDASGVGRAVVSPVKHKSDIERSFDTMVYFKGAAIYSMLCDVLGGYNFQLLWQHLLKKYMYSNLSYKQFVDEAENFVRKYGDRNGRWFDVRSFLNTWLLQRGVPVVTITRQGGQRLIISQRKLNLKRRNTDREVHWEIPVQIHSSDGEPLGPIKWLRRNDVTNFLLPANQSDNFILADVSISGYYVINYDVDNWERIARAIVKNASVVSDMYHVRLWNHISFLSRSYDLDIRALIHMLPTVLSANWETWDMVLDSAIPLMENLIFAFHDQDRLLSYIRNIAAQLPHFKKRKVLCKIAPTSASCVDDAVTMGKLRHASISDISAILTNYERMFFAPGTRERIFEMIGRNSTSRSLFIESRLLTGLAKRTHSRFVLHELEAWSRHVQQDQIATQLDNIESLIRDVSKNVAWRENNLNTIESLQFEEM